MKLRGRLSALAVSAALAISFAVVPATSADAATKCTANRYGPGGYSACVGYIQTMLNEWASTYGIAKISVDNSFGNATTSRVKEFQGDMWNPQLAADGWVGPATWQALCGYGRTGSAAGKAAATKAGC